jgi:hypothetical protein
MKNLIKLLMLAAAAAALQASPALAVGRFVYVTGDVTVRNTEGASRPVKSGDALNEKDAIQVGEGRAQVRFDDGGWVSLQPRTVIEVSEFPRRDDGNIVLALLKGSARAVTGVLSRRNPANYRLVTPTATIGIRGTSFQVTYCLQSCDLPDGLYVTGGDGTIYVKNAIGEIDLSRGRTAYVPNAQTAPRESNVKPVVGLEEPMSAQQTAAVGSTTAAELRPGNFIYFQGSSGYVGPFEFRSVSSGGIAVAATGTLTGSASGVVQGVFGSATGSGSGAGSGAGGGNVEPGNTLTLVMDGAQRPVSITLLASNGDRVSATALTAPEMSASDGILFWGRWTGTRFQLDLQSAQNGGANVTGTATFPAGSYLHYLIGTPVGSAPMIGSATYTFIGGTGSTSLLGTVDAGVTAGTLTANFGANTVNAGMSISHGGTFSASGFATIQGSNRARFSSVTGTASGPGGSFPFKFDGFFAGTSAPTAPPRAGVGWTIDRPDAISGTAAFRCATGC